MAGIEPALQHTCTFFGQVTASHSCLCCLTISRPFADAWGIEPQMASSFRLLLATSFWHFTINHSHLFAGVVFTQHYDICQPAERLRVFQGFWLMICLRLDYYKPFFILLAPSLTTASLSLLLLAVLKTRRLSHLARL